MRWVLRASSRARVGRVGLARKMDAIDTRFDEVVVQMGEGDTVVAMEWFEVCLLNEARILVERSNVSRDSRFDVF